MRRAGAVLNQVGTTAFVPLILLFLPVRGSAGEPYVWPTTPPTSVTSTVGEYREDHLHDGLDFSVHNEPDRPVRAVDTGTVHRLFYDSERYGKTVILRHEDGRFTWYSHLRNVHPDLIPDRSGQLSPGDDIIPRSSVPVTRGEPLGTVGKTGRGPLHLHFSLRERSGEVLNPLGRFEPDLPYDPRPHLDAIFLVPFGTDSRVNGRVRPVRVPGPGNAPISVRGRLGVETRAWNEHRDHRHRSLPYRVLLRRDGNVVFERVFDRLGPVEQKQGVHRIFHEPFTNLTPTSFMIHLTPRGPDGRWKGLEFLDPGRRGTVSVTIETARGRTRKRVWRYRVAKPGRAYGGEPVHIPTHKSRPRRNRKRPGEHGKTVDSRSTASKPAMRFWFPDARRFSDAVTASGLRMLWRGGGVKLRVNPPFQVPSAFSMTVVGPHYQRRIRMSRRTAGRYAGWWRPDPSRVPRGSYRLKPEGPGLHRTWPKKNIFYQPVETGSAAVVRSRDRRYHLEIEGRGLSFSTALSFEPVPEAPAAPEELTPLEEPRQLLPRTLESLDPMHLSVELPPAIQTPAKQVGLYRWNPVSRAWRPVSHRPGPTPHSRRTTVWSSAVVGLFRDSHPPELGEVRVNRTESALWIPVRETGSGVNARSLRAHQQQREIPVRWNKYNRRLEIPRDTLTPGDQPVRVTVHDRAGNRQSTTVSAADLP